MTEISKARLLDILLSFGIREDLHIERIYDEKEPSFINLFSVYVIKGPKSGKAVDLECILLLLCEFSKMNPKYLDDKVVFDIIELIPHCYFNGKSMCKLLDFLRTGVRTLGSSEINPLYIDLKFHSQILAHLNKCIIQDNPSHISFPGDKDSFVQISSIPITCTKAYTMTMWLKMPADSPQNKGGFILHRCRSPNSGIDAVISNIQPDGTCSLSIRTNNERKGKGEIQAKVYLPVGEWHLLVIKQYVGSGGEKISISVDGSQSFEGDIFYPFVSPIESLWVFGQYFKGLFASISLYSEDIGDDMIQLMHSLGPYVSDLSLGVSCPQTSFDTGHLILGTQIAKGRLALKACKCTPVFSIKAQNMAPDAILPLVSTGKLYQEYIEMVPRLQEHDAPLIASMTGGCTVSLKNSWVDAWVDAGGVSLAMYIFSTYCTAFSTSSKNNSTAAVASTSSTATSPVPSSKHDDLLSCMKCSLTITANLNRLSADMKEQLIQLHGFHVIGFCLSSLPEDIKKTYLDAQFIDICIDLVKSLGLDALKGDGIAAALQGLLFDFRIWGGLSIPCLKYYLEHLSTQLLDCGKQLYTCIGIQRILNVFRLHVARLYANNSDAETQKNAIECADSMHRLLIIGMDAARSFALKKKVSLSYEAEILLSCLEETNNCLIAERILRMVGNMRVQSPVSLSLALASTRYQETIVIALLNKKGFSIEVRSSALVNLFWHFGEEMRAQVQQVMQSRKVLNSIILGFINTTSGGGGSNRGGGGRHKSMTTLDINRVKSLTLQLNDSIKPLSKTWNTMIMVVEVLSRALNDEVWGKVYPTCLRNLNETPSISSVTSTSKAPPNLIQCRSEMDTLVNSFTHGSQMEAWLMMPVLPVLLSRCSISVCQNVLMSLNVMFKTDPCQSEALSCLPDRSWIQQFVSLACIGEVYYANNGQSAFLESVSTGNNKSESDAAGTCTELSLDILSIVLEYKTRHHSSDAWSTWNCLQNCIKSSCTNYFGETDLAGAVELKFLKHCVSLVFQRLAKNSEGWNAGILTVVVNILTFLDNRKLCGSESLKLVEANKAAAVQSAVESSLLDLNFSGTSSSSSTLLEGMAHHASTDNKPSKIMTANESQILCCVLDLTNSIRKAAEKGILQGLEWPALKLAMKIVLSCLSIVSESIADRISNEVLSYIKYTSDSWAPLTEDAYKNSLMNILVELRFVIHNKTTPDFLRGRYSALVFAIMHFYIEIRHSLAEGNSIPTQVLSTLDALSGVDTCNDIDHIFKLLDVTMFKSSAISFEDSEKSSPAVVTLAAPPVALTADLLSLDGPELDFLSGSNNVISVSKPPNADNAKLGPGLDSSNNLLDMLDVSVMSPREDPFQVGAAAIASDEYHMVDSRHGIDSSRHGETDVEVENKTPQPTLTPEQTEQQSRELKFSLWLKTRQGISTDRVDSERARLARSMNALDLSSEATKKFWKKARRKIESESFHESHHCQWKLGVAHEGHFPSRKRVVLRPRFDNEYGMVGDAVWGQEAPPCGTSGEESDIPTLKSAVSSEELNRALAKACAGYITDVTRDENGHGAEMDDSQHSRRSADNNKSDVKVPGSGWGLVDVDGSEDGYGVVGVALESSVATVDDKLSEKKATSPEISPAPNDLMGDVKQIEENIKQGKGNETGPCHSGTRRIDSGPAVLEASVILITASGNFWGSLSYNGKEIFFTSTFDAENSSRDDCASVTLVKQVRMRRRRWVLSSVSAIYLRRFRLRDSAMEVFFSRGKHRNFFVDFGHTRENAKQRNEFARALMLAAPNTAFKQMPTMSHFRLVYDHGVQDKWLNGKLSNFDYLMALNTIAGRSYNDLCQYPVMPWILSDYSSKTLDLSDKSIYRDLSKPMGALNQNRLNEFMDRFNSFEENVTSGIPPFMYGSHYSTMVGVVLHFLVRLQPFAALHKEMQNGHFDVPDRLFSSIPRSFRHNTTQLSEVKELTPEWFTTPEMFKNINHFDFGMTQDNEMVDDVELPAWASTAEEFVRIHREALESDYVTEHLHEWIDLIFGYKQRGPDAVEAHNVFYYLTYYGSVDHYMIEDETLRRATELQIAHFGQIPMQLFKIPHPARKLSGSGAQNPLTRQFKKNFVPNNTESLVKPTCDEECIAIEGAATLVNKQTNTNTLSVSILNDRLLCVMDNGVIEVLKYSTSEEAKSALVINAAAPKAVANRKKSTAITGSSIDSNGDLLSFEDPVDAYSATFEDTNNSKRHNIMDKYDPVIYVEKDFTHFDTIPRIPLPKPTRSRLVGSTDNDFFDKLIKVKPTTTTNESSMELASGLIHFTKVGNVVLSVGQIDGRVSVRELDSKTGFVKTAGDFRAHKKRIVSISTDAIPFASTDVVTTCDESGLIMVWTISKVRGAGGLTHNYVISRRPQRVFRCDPKPDMCCDISWQMGIVVCVSGVTVQIFSIERDELLAFYLIDVTELQEHATSWRKADFSGFTFTGPEHHVFGSANQAYYSGKDDYFRHKSVTRRIVLSDSGVVVIHVETYHFIESLLEYEDQVQHQHLLLSYTLSGFRCGFLKCASPVTHLSCPDRGDVVISGHQDGSIFLYRPQDLNVIYTFSPHLNCTYVVLSLTPVKMKDREQAAADKEASRRASTAGSGNRGSSSGGGSNHGKGPTSNPDKVVKRSLTSDPSPVISVCIGPNKAFPSMICVTTESGNIFLKALPDFIKWEKNRSPSALAQLTSVPMQAVRGTIQQAQNWTAETAGVLAQNARWFADDAMGELKKMKKNSIVKGVAGFFGIGGRNNNDSDEEGNSSK